MQDIYHQQYVPKLNGKFLSGHYETFKTAEIKQCSLIKGFWSLPVKVRPASKSTSFAA